MEMEIKEWCSQSVIEMKKGIASTLSKYKFNADTISRLRIRVGGADKKLDPLRAPKGAELKCIRRTKLMLP